MTEIPEHLLQRSRERRAAISGGDSDGGGGDTGTPSAETEPTDKPVAAAPATPALPAHPAPPAEKEPEPLSPMAQAYTRRRKVPWWAMTVLASLPIWAYVYVGTLEPPPRETAATLGTSLYATNCAQCHGGSGGGGIGPAFTSGAIFETWPSFEDHFEWVRSGSAGWPEDTYGANNKPVGGGGQMPGFEEGAISDSALVFIILHERELGGENPDPEDQARLHALADIMFEHEEMTLEAAQEELEAGLADGTITLQPAE